MFGFRMAPGFHGGPDRLGPATSDRFYTLSQAKKALGDSKNVWIVRVDDDNNATHVLVYRTYAYYRAYDPDSSWLGPVRRRLSAVERDVAKRRARGRAVVVAADSDDPRTEALTPTEPVGKLGFNFWRSEVA